MFPDFPLQRLAGKLTSDLHEPGSPGRTSNPMDPVNPPDSATAAPAPGPRRGRAFLPDEASSPRAANMAGQVPPGDLEAQIDALFADAVKARGLQAAPRVAEPVAAAPPPRLFSYALPQSDTVAPGRMFFKAFAIIFVGSLAGLYWDWSSRMRGKEAERDALRAEKRTLLEDLKNRGISEAAIANALREARDKPAASADEKGR